eukprot:TRINITY_DN11353_c0_g1_i3.p1 TRINITY_DN11353_c0_g1~~TRINITY_DN11353_c0_g1_i3.p1  ORF type:complete len:507 (+),score=146.24 TRINITY_DN11353_c0_g1_i3:121-1521(+)
MADDEPQSSAMDYVKNAWALLRGNPSDVRGPETPKAGGLSIAQASLALAGGPAGKGKEFDEVEFFKHAWALYQQAMEEGWVAEWIEQFCTKDVKCVDHIGDILPGQPLPLIFKNHSGVCKFYNMVLKNVWNNGNSTVVWKPRSFTGMGRGSGVVMAEFDIEVTPRGISHPRQLWVYHVTNDKITDVYIYPLGEREQPSRPQAPVDPMSNTMNTSYSSLNNTMASMPGVPHAPVQNTPPMPNAYPPQYAESAHSTEPPNLMDTMHTPRGGQAAATAAAGSGTMPGSVGVALSRPCSHNSWDNVRIKRGWAILRCRICQSQWRLRPTAIPHCPDFARGAGCCPRGTECSQLHVHRTREQSSDAKKSGAGSQTGSQNPLGTPLSLPNATHSPGNSPTSAGYSNMKPPQYAYAQAADPYGSGAQYSQSATDSYAHDPYDVSVGRSTPPPYKQSLPHVASTTSLEAGDESE